MDIMGLKNMVTSDDKTCTACITGSDEPITYGYDHYDIDLSIIKYGDVMNRVAKDYNIKIIECDIDDRYDCWGEDSIINSSHIIGHSEIVNGRWDTPELKLTAFFHEIGHTLVTKDFMISHNWNTFMIEIEASFLGFELAKRYGITILKENKQYLYNGTVRSYVDYK